MLTTHHIKLRFTGEGANTKAYGVKATLKTNITTQYLELYPVRSYQSTIAQELVFGFPEKDSIHQIINDWPGGKQTILTYKIRSGTAIKAI